MSLLEIPYEEMGEGVESLKSTGRRYQASWSSSFCCKEHLHVRTHAHTHTRTLKGLTERDRQKGSAFESLPRLDSVEICVTDMLPAGEVQCVEFCLPPAVAAPRGA
jgi:hypothetical protein